MEIPAIPPSGSFPRDEPADLLARREDDTAADGSGGGGGGGIGEGNGFSEGGSENGHVATGPGGGGIGTGYGTGIGSGVGPGSGSGIGTGSGSGIGSGTGSGGEEAAVAVAPPIFNANYLSNPAPVYPLTARKLRLQGTVIVRVRVSPEGKPDVVQLEKSSGVPLLDGSALDAVKKWKFVPARSGDSAVSAWVDVPIRFLLN